MNIDHKITTSFDTIEENFHKSLHYIFVILPVGLGKSWF